MSRTIKSVKRPDDHIFSENADLGTDYNGRRFCHCSLREDDSVHIQPSDLPETPPEDRSDEIVGSE